MRTIEVPHDVKKKYLSGGFWKAKIIPKLGKHKHESTKPGRRYFAIPPIGGWLGGLEENNGWKPRSSK